MKKWINKHKVISGFIAVGTLLCIVSTIIPNSALVLGRIFGIFIFLFLVYKFQTHLEKKKEKKDFLETKKHNVGDFHDKR